MNRAEQRAALIAARRKITTQQRKEWDAQIGQHVVDWCKTHSVQLAGIYSPIQGEPSLHDIFPILSNMGIKLALPSIAAKNLPLLFSLWQPGEELMKDKHGVLVPLETSPKVKPEVLFIPCVGFTKEGYRLGYGGGFYDRTLAEHPKPHAIGIAYQLSECELEVMPHDVPLDRVMTNK